MYSEKLMFACACSCRLCVCVYWHVYGQCTIQLSYMYQWRLDSSGSVKYVLVGCVCMYCKSGYIFVFDLRARAYEKKMNRNFIHNRCFHWSRATCMKIKMDELILHESFAKRDIPDLQYSSLCELHVHVVVLALCLHVCTCV